MVEPNIISQGHSHRPKKVGTREMVLVERDCFVVNHNENTTIRDADFLSF